MYLISKQDFDHASCVLEQCLRDWINGRRVSGRASVVEASEQGHPPYKLCKHHQRPAHRPRTHSFIRMVSETSYWYYLDTMRLLRFRLECWVEYGKFQVSSMVIPENGDELLSTESECLKTEL